MKILILSQYWYPENNVPQRRWSWLAKILVDAGHEVTVVAPPPHNQRKITVKQWLVSKEFRSYIETGPGPSGERIVRSAFFPAGPSLTQRILNQAVVGAGTVWTMLRRPGDLACYRPDLVIGTVPAIPTAAALWIVAKRLRVPYIVDLRDAWPDLLEESDGWNKVTGESSKRERVLKRGPLQLLTASTRKMLNGVLKNAAAITVTSSHLAQDLQSRRVIQTDGLAPPIVTIRNVFPVLTEVDSVDEPLDDPDGLNVLYAGTMGRAQNLANVLAAAAIAREQGTKINLRFVGAGVARDVLVAQAKENDLPVLFEARHPADDLARYYEWADTALVHLTDWEALRRAVPSKTYELMSAGIHISGVVQGETAEIIRNHSAGDVVEPESPLELAKLWSSLAENRSRLNVPPQGGQWVLQQRQEVAPTTLLGIIDQVGSK